jgi:hypothetical protein
VDQFSVRGERAAVGLERPPAQSTEASKSRSSFAAFGIVTIQRSRAWDNYRLLHHFDGREQLDRI